MSQKELEYTIRDLVITDEFDTILSDASIVDAAKKMRAKAIPDLVVLDVKSNNVLGVIADFDIIQNIIAESKDPVKEKVTAALYSIEPVTLNTPIKIALERMQKLHVNVVPVVENNKLLGVASLNDCYGFIPAEKEDSVGLIPVKNPKNAEFWFASVCALLAFLFGVLLPLAGIVAYFNGSDTDIATMLNFITIRSATIEFSVFEAHGTDFYLSYFKAVNNLGAAWYLVIINGFLLMIFGTIGIFSIFYSSYSDLRNIYSGKSVRTRLPIIALIVMILEWIFMAIGFIGTNVSINAFGLTMSIFSMLLIIIAMKRDYLFKQAPQSKGA